jgi:DNA-binding NarL/FixJ family response regulator
MSVRVFLIENNDVVREGLGSYIERDGGNKLVGFSSNGSDALKKLKTNSIDVLLIDVYHPAVDGFAHVRKIKSDYPRLKILLLMAGDQEKYFVETIECGSNGHMDKNCTQSDLLTAIKIVSRDGIYMCGEFTLKMLDKYREAKEYIHKSKRPVPNLSEREAEVLELIGEGFTNAEMANALFTSVRTIETRRKRLLDKTGTQNTATLVKFAVVNGMLK